MRHILFASGNPHKLEELRRILLPMGIRPVRPEGLVLPQETGSSFQENARQKARHLFDATGLPALADDSGLEVRALGGRPGVRSARFSPQATAAANNRRLLDELRGVRDRRAVFVCVLALVAPAGEAIARGEVRGAIATEPRGSLGFGYDPLFLPDEAPGRTMAELEPAEKDLISHRGRALAELPGMVDRLLGRACAGRP